MADPVTWMVVLSAAATTVSAVGAVRQGQAAAGAANYNAELGRQNAQVANDQSIAASDTQRRDAERRMGTAMAQYGASGVQMSDGSPSDVLAESARMATLDSLTSKYNYKLKALGYLNQSALDTSNASNASTAGYLNAAGTLLNGSAKTAGYYNFG